MAKKFEEDIRKTGKEMDCWFRKLRDMELYRGSSSPFDFVFWDGNVFLAIECKEVNGSAKSLNFDKIKEHQVEGLKTINSFENSLGVYLINFRNIRYSEKYKGKGKVYISLPDYIEKLKTDISKGEYLDKYPRNKKSIPLDIFKNNCRGLQRKKLDVGGYGWDINYLLQSNLKQELFNDREGVISCV